MEERNLELLDEVIKNRLEKAQHPDVESEEKKHAFKEAMEALSKKIEFAKVEASHKEAKTDRWIQVGTFAAGLIVAPIIKQLIDRSNMKALCNFEKDYTFTTSFGRGFSSYLSRFTK